MTCDLYHQHELGELDDELFQNHLPDCAACQRFVQQDRELVALARDLRQVHEAPFLWVKIENMLRAEKQRRKQVWPQFAFHQKYAALALAATVILAVGLGSYLFLKQPGQDESRLLAARALERVEQQERAHLDAIAGLEQVALPQMAQMDPELMLLYRDRLETIEAQIARCREALADNPANAHIRRYLLAALQDKKETLREILVEVKG